MSAFEKGPGSQQRAASPNPTASIAASDLSSISDDWLLTCRPLRSPEWLPVNKQIKTRYRRRQTARPAGSGRAPKKMQADMRVRTVVCPRAQMLRG